MSYYYKPDGGGSFKLVLLVVAVLTLMIWLTGCATQKKGAPLTSLCIMDFDAQMCWTNKSLKKGVSFVEMKKFQEECSGGIDFPCWYSLNSSDVMRLGN